MKAYIRDIVDFSVLVQFEDRGRQLQRKWISRDVYTDSIKFVTVDIPASELKSGIDYSDVSLVDNLGKNYKGIHVAELEQAFRRAGFWKREDYINNPGGVAKVVSGFPGIDTTEAINAAARFIGD